MTWSPVISTAGALREGYEVGYGMVMSGSGG